MIDSNRTLVFWVTLDCHTDETPYLIRPISSQPMFQGKRLFLTDKGELSKSDFRELVTAGGGKVSGGEKWGWCSNRLAFFALQKQQQQAWVFSMKAPAKQCPNNNKKIYIIFFFLIPFNFSHFLNITLCSSRFYIKNHLSTTTTSSSLVYLLSTISSICD